VRRVALLEVPVFQSKLPCLSTFVKPSTFIILIPTRASKKMHSTIPLPSSTVVVVCSSNRHHFLHSIHGLRLPKASLKPRARRRRTNELKWVPHWASFTSFCCHYRPARGPPPASIDPNPNPAYRIRSRSSCFNGAGVHSTQPGASC